MKEKFRKISEAMDKYIETKSFKWFRTLILILGFTATGSICFLAGFFLNRQDNMIYQSNIRVMEREDTEEASPVNSAAVTDVPEQTSEPVSTTVITTTEPPRVTLSRELLDSYIYEDLEFSPFEYRYSNTAAFSSRSTLYDYSIPLTKKSFTITYDGIITAGFDSSDILIDTDDDLYTITVSLPEGYIISHEIDTDSFELENVTDNMFNPISLSDYLSTCEAQNEKMERRAEASGLYSKMYSEAEDIIREYLMRDGIIGAKYTIIFTHPENL